MLYLFYVKICHVPISQCILYSVCCICWVFSFFHGLHPLLNTVVTTVVLSEGLGSRYVHAVCHVAFQTVNRTRCNGAICQRTWGVYYIYNDYIRQVFWESLFTVAANMTFKKKIKFWTVLLNIEHMDMEQCHNLFCILQSSLATFNIT